MTDTTMAEYEENVDTPRPGESGLRIRDRRRLRSRCLFGKKTASPGSEKVSALLFRKANFEIQKMMVELSFGKNCRT